MIEQETRVYFYGGPLDGALLYKEGCTEVDYLPEFYDAVSPVFGPYLLHRYKRIGYRFLQDNKTVVLRADMGLAGHLQMRGKELKQDGQA